MLILYTLMEFFVPNAILPKTHFLDKTRLVAPAGKLHIHIFEF